MLTLQGAVLYAIGKGYTIDYGYDNPTVSLNSVEFYGASPGEIHKSMVKHLFLEYSVKHHALKIALGKLARVEQWPVSFPGYNPQ